MPRIRTIKPEFWSDEKLATLSPVDRLTFLGLISLSDDYGRVHDNAKVIDAFIFPETSGTVRESLANLSRIGRIRRGRAANGKRILEIVNWEKHQRVDKPQPHLCLPAMCEETSENAGENAIREPFATDSGMAPELVGPLPRTEEQEHRAGPTTNDQDRNIAATESPRCEYPAGFEEFWRAYPANDKGRKRGKKVTEGLWRKVPTGDRPGMVAAAKAYRQEVETRGTLVRDPERFIRNDFWRDYLGEPEEQRRPDVSNDPRGNMALLASIENRTEGGSDATGI